MKTDPVPRALPAAVLTVLLASGALAPPARAQHEVHGRADATGVIFPEGTDRLEVPFRFEGSQILLDLSVEGSEPLSVILDTGMPMPGLVLFDSDRTRSLDLEPAGAGARIGGAGGEGHHVEAQAATGAVALGRLRFEGMRILVLPPMGHFAISHHGIIGASLFRNFTVQLDFDRKRMTLHKPGTWRPAEGAATVPITLRQGLPYVKGRLETPGGGSEEIEVVLDLGAGHFISLNASGHDGIEVPPGAIRTPIGRGLSGEIRGRVGRVPGIVLGGIRAEGVVATFPDPEFENPRGVDSLDGNLGARLAGRFNLTLDYAGGVLHLEPNASFEDPYEWDMSGLVLEPGEKGELVVREVVPGTPAEAAGLEAGDAILELDGLPVGAGDREAVRRALRRDGAEVTVKYGRGGETGTKVLVLRRRV